MKTTQLHQFAFRVLAVMALASGSVILSGATLNYSGTFPDAGNPNALYEVQFTTSAAANLTIATSSVSPANGDGVQAVLWFFNSAGTTQLTKDDPPFDVEALINTAQSAGTYLLVLSSFDQHYCVANSQCNLPPGMVYANTGWSYTGDFGDDSLAFNFSITADRGELTQNSASFDPSPTRAFPVAVPEPASFALFMVAGALLVLRLWARKSSWLLVRGSWFPELATTNQQPRTSNHKR